MRAEEPALTRRMVAAATVGNALEFYDFITYAFFSIQIGHAFFPAHDSYSSLMLSLATFGAGFVTRPIGGVIIGAYSDRVGRRPAMMLSFMLMGAAILALALIPPYSKIGVTAPILAVLARMVQGFSLGGEVGPTTAYLMEAAPLNGRGLAVSWQVASQQIAATIAGLVGVGLSYLMTPAALDSYGWRIAFLIGAITLPFGLWIRRRLPETLYTEEPTARASASAKVSGMVRENARIIVLILLAIGASTIGSYAFNYMTTFAEATLHLAPRVAFLAPMLGNAASVLAMLYCGSLSDRIGRRPAMIWPNVIYLLMVLPVFLWIIMSRSSLALVLGLVMLAVVGLSGQGAFFAAASESLPKRMRGGTIATVYALAVAIFGGTTQLLITWLIHVTGSPMAPVWYLLVASAIGLGAKMLIPESAPAKARPPLSD